jgi:hypothetical protein
MACKNPSGAPDFDCDYDPIKCRLCNTVGITQGIIGYSCNAKSKEDCFKHKCPLIKECNKVFEEEKH